MSQPRIEFQIDNCDPKPLLELSPSKAEWDITNDKLKVKSGREIMKYLRVDFVNSDIAKGISDIEISYIPDFGYENPIEFGERIKKSGWKMMFDWVIKHPK